MKIKPPFVIEDYKGFWWLWVLCGRKRECVGRTTTSVHTHWTWWG